MTIVAATHCNGYQYRCIVTDQYGNSVTSKAAKLTVADYAEIVSNPESVSAKKDETVKFTVAATGDGLTYRWQYKGPDGKWTNSSASGYQTDTLTIVAATHRNGYQYRCVITDQYGNKVTSDAATLTIVAYAEIVSNPKSVSAQKGETVKFTVVATGDGLTYRWQYKEPNGSWTNSNTSGCKTDTLTVAASAHRNGFQYRCVVTDQYGNKVTSDAAALTIVAYAEIISNPESVSAQKGATVKFTVVATGDGLTYRWQYKTPSGSWKDTTSTGSKTDALSVSAATYRNGYQYRCVIVDQYDNEVSTIAVTLKVID